MTAETRDGDVAIADDAPVVSSVELEIDAPVGAVWDVLVAIDEWPGWNPDVKSVSIEGPARKGASFRWKAGPSTIRSTIVQFDRPRLLAWTGRTLGIHAVHVWRLEQLGSGTLVRTEESYEGVVARILRRPLQKTLHKALADGTAYLKAEAEKISPGTR
jgi:hypothetical protein